MKERTWGEEKDKAAAQQLGVGEDFTIFMMASMLSHAEDFDAVKEEFGDDGYVHINEILSSVEDHLMDVVLPVGFRFVGMSPIGKDEPKKYGIVDFTKFGAA